MRGVYIASQLSVGRVGHRHLMTKITFDKGGVWQQIAAPKVDNNGKLLNCSLVSPKVNHHHHCHHHHHRRHHHRRRHHHHHHHNHHHHHHLLL